MDSLHGILVFLRVAEAGTLSGAARGLGVSTSAVSAALARLERKLAVRLLDRTTRRLSMTAEGREFYARCKRITADLEEAELAVGRAGRVPSGRLRVGMPPGLARLWILPRLPQFTRSYPAVSLEIVCRDFTSQTQDGDLDVSVRSGELQASRLAVRRLASSLYVVCASPDYLAARGAPRTLDDLARHDCLLYRRPRNGRLRQWRFRQGGGVRAVPVNGTMICNSNEALVTAAEAGLGMIRVAEFYARPLLESGRLIEVLEEYKTGGYEISVVFPQQQHVTPRHRVFVDFLVSIFSEPPWTRARGRGIRAAG
jgi:LysR family transcriptional regulator for bpeEF and oprC